LWVGSIKTFIEHTEGTAGIAGLLKASLAVQQGIIPPNLLFDNLNPAVEPFYTNLEIPTTAIAWPRVGDGSPRRASVNSFGFGGTNAHVIIEHFSTTTQQRDKIGTQFTPFVFSAASEPALRAALSSFYDFLGDNPDTDIHDLSYTLYQCSQWAGRKWVTYPFSPTHLGMVPCFFKIGIT
jgi:hybrid polyketide synthase/nonribosomal peptide synthetase ACE1